MRITTKFKEEQTGVACYFHKRSRLATLPCPYFYDIAYEQHVPRGVHHMGCLTIGVGKHGDAGSAQCNASATHVKRHCTWEASYETAKVCIDALAIFCSRPVTSFWQHALIFLAALCRIASSHHLGSTSALPRLNPRMHSPHCARTHFTHRPPTPPANYRRLPGRSLQGLRKAMARLLLLRITRGAAGAAASEPDAGPE